MAAISAVQVKNLREETGLPMMECKAALTEAEGDPDKAKELLQKKFKGKMASRAANVTGEGRIGLYISDDATRGSIVDFRCETAPVAKTDQFLDLVSAIAQAVAEQDDPEPAVEKVMSLPSPRTPGRTLQDELTEVFGLLRENLRLLGAKRAAGGYVCGYVHHDGKSGVLIAMDAKPNPESVATDLCHHAVFANPMAIDRSGIPEAEIEKARRIAREVAEGEGKPAQIIEKIVEGKVNAYCAENALMEQEHVKVSKTKVKDVLAQAGVKSVAQCALKRIG